MNPEDLAEIEKRQPTDPRELGGDIVGPGGPHDEGGVLVDTRRAVMLDDVTVSTVDSNQGSIIAMLLGGRINKSTDRASVLFLMPLDGAAAIITEFMALSARAGAQDQLMDAVDRRLDRLMEDGHEQRETDS